MDAPLTAPCSDCAGSSPVSARKQRWNSDHSCFVPVVPALAQGRPHQAHQQLPRIKRRLQPLTRRQAAAHPHEFNVNGIKPKGFSHGPVIPSFSPISASQIRPPSDRPGRRQHQLVQQPHRPQRRQLPRCRCGCERGRVGMDAFVVGEYAEATVFGLTVPTVEAVPAGPAQGWRLTPLVSLLFRRWAAL